MGGSLSTVAELATRGILIKGKDGKITRQMKIAGMSKRHRYVFFRLEIAPFINFINSRHAITKWRGEDRATCELAVMSVVISQVKPAKSAISANKQWRFRASGYCVPVG
jgi:hypothetical protein